MGAQSLQGGCGLLSSCSHVTIVRVIEYGTGKKPMQSHMRTRLILFISTLIFFVALLAWHFQSAKSAKRSPVSAPTPTVEATSSTSLVIRDSAASSDSGTSVWAHNLMLRKGPGFRVYVRWLRGQMVRVDRDVNPSFDEPDSFVLDVKTGVIHTNVGDLANFLNEGLTNSPLRNVTSTLATMSWPNSR